MTTEAYAHQDPTRRCGIGFDTRPVRTDQRSDRMSVPILIPHASGTNRDLEAAQAIELAGGTPTIAHVNELRSGAVKIADHAAILLPGGFSYGDALGAGGRLALELRTWFADELAAAAQAGTPMLGICNGFQVLVKAGLLPGPMSEPRSVTLTENAEGRFEVGSRCRSNPVCGRAGSVRWAARRSAVRSRRRRSVAVSDDSVAARLEDGLVASGIWPMVPARRAMILSLPPGRTQPIPMARSTTSPASATTPAPLSG